MSSFKLINALKGKKKVKDPLDEDQDEFNNFNLWTMYIIIFLHDCNDFFYTVLYFYFMPFTFFAFLIYIFVHNVGS